MRALAAMVLVTALIGSPGAGATTGTGTSERRPDIAETLRYFEDLRDGVNAYLDTSSGLLGGTNPFPPDLAAEGLRALGEGVTRRAQLFDDPKVIDAAKDAVAKMNQAATNIEGGDIGQAVLRVIESTDGINAIIERLIDLAQKKKQAVTATGEPGELSTGSSNFERTVSEFRARFHSAAYFGEIVIEGRVTGSCPGEAGSFFRFSGGLWDPIYGFGRGAFTHLSFFEPAPDAGPGCPPRPLDLVEHGSVTLQADEKGRVRGILTSPRDGGVFSIPFTGSIPRNQHLRFVEAARRDLDAFGGPIVRKQDPDFAHLCDSTQITDDPGINIGSTRLFFDPDGRVRIETSFLGLDELNGSPFGIVVREQFADGTEMAHRVRVAENGAPSAESLDPDTLEPAEQTPEDVIARITRDAVKLTYKAPAPPTQVDVDSAAEFQGTRICDDATMATASPPVSSREQARLVDAALAFDSFKIVERLVSSSGSSGIGDKARARVLRGLADDLEREAARVSDPALTDAAERAANSWREAADAFEDDKPSRGRAQAVNGLGDLKEALGRIDELIDPSVVLPEFK